MLNGNEDLFTKGVDGTYSLTLNLSKESDFEKLNIKKSVEKGLVVITDEGNVSITALDNKLCGSKYSSSEVINMLSIKDDFSCYLLDSSSENIGTNDILKAIQNLKDSNENLSKKVQELTVSNDELKQEIKNINNNGIGTNNALNRIYPIGSIYISTNLNTPDKVKEALGGEWENYGTNRVLRGTTSTSNQTGGTTGNISLTESNLPSHSHSIGHTHTIASKTYSTTRANLTGSIMMHNAADSTVVHGYSGIVSAGLVNSNKYTALGTLATTGAPSIGILNIDASHSHTITIGEQTTSTQSSTTSGKVGNNTSFSVLDPYITVYMYKRIK